jgi:hypothetical protein
VGSSRKIRDEKRELEKIIKKDIHHETSETTIFVLVFPSTTSFMKFPPIEGSMAPIFLRTSGPKPPKFVASMPGEMQNT